MSTGARHSKAAHIALAIAGPLIVIVLMAVPLQRLWATLAEPSSPISAPIALTRSTLLCVATTPESGWRPVDPKALSIPNSDTFVLLCASPRESE